MNAHHELGAQDEEPRKEVSADLPLVDLRPMEIRTFIVRLEKQ